MFDTFLVDWILSKEAQIFCAIIGCISAFWVVVYYVNSVLSHKYGSDIRLVWYFFSLSLVTTFIIACWATDKGAISYDGKFNGSQGASLKKLLEVMLDINFDLKIIYTIILLIVLPQLFSYILSGLFGCASAPRFIKGSFNILVLGVVKTFSVTSGIVISLFLFGWWKGWVALSLTKALVILFTPMTMIALSFVVLLEYRAAEVLADDFKRRYPHLQKRLVAIHMLATRSESRDG